MKHLIIFVLALLTYSSASAVSQGGYYTVTRLYVWTNGDAHLWVDKAGSHKCTDKRYANRYLLAPDAKGFDAKFALLLSARVTGGKVNMEYDCINGIPYIKAIRH